MKIQPLITAVQFIHSLAIGAIIAMVCMWEVIHVYHQLFPAK